MKTAILWIVAGMILAHYIPERYQYAAYRKTKQVAVSGYHAAKIFAIEVVK